MIEVLFEENNWSKATYGYLLASSLFEQNRGQPDDRIRALYRKVPSLKIRLAGKSIPIEKYAIRQCERFFDDDWLFLPALVCIDSYQQTFVHTHDSILICLFSIQGDNLSNQWILYICSSRSDVEESFENCGRSHR